VTAGGRALLHCDLIITLAARHKLPTVYFDRSFVAARGLLSYGPDRIDMWRRSGAISLKSLLARHLHGRQLHTHSSRYLVYAPDDTVMAIYIFNDYAGAEESNGRALMGLGRILPPCRSSTRNHVTSIFISTAKANRVHGPGNLGMSAAYRCLAASPSLITACVIRFTLGTELMR
jgi:hypothetical protein